MLASTSQEITPAELEALQALVNNKAVERLRDVKIYTEACITCKNQRDNVVMVVANDHPFFKVFGKNTIAENMLLGQVQAFVKEAQLFEGVEDTYPLIHVKAAGEIM